MSVGCTDPPVVAHAALARFHCCDRDHDDADRRVGERDHRRARPGLQEPIRVHRVGLRLSDAGHGRRDPSHPCPHRRRNPTTSSSPTTTRARRRGRGGRPVVHALAQRGLQGVQAHRSMVRCTSSRTTRLASPFVIADSRGKVVSRDRGNLVSNYTYDFETGEFNFLGNQLHGPHPMFDLDLCLAVAPLVGTVRLGEVPDGAADRLDRLAERLRRIPAAELHGRPARRARCSSSSTDTARPATGRPEAIGGSSRPASRSTSTSAAGHRPAVRRARHAARRGPPGFDFSTCDGAHSAGPATCSSSTTTATFNRPSAPRPRGR